MIIYDEDGTIHNSLPNLAGGIISEIINDPIELVYKFNDMESCSAEIGNVLEHLENVRLSSERLADNLSFWQGEAKLKFIEKSNALFKDMQKIYDSLNERKTQLDKAIDMQRENELGIKNTVVNPLSSSDIF